ncbi:hypothetical protein BIV57_06535 [Mangrovactinospora gilvigrisea]|uniref:DUF3830 domain-containing protein n=1 Tax=Mangrovactinospora gilvigrisea TaxID=1428644 RepID=A0A1J7CF34_9ACTN|nr:DUF3830 family protein [Mangrovactinospora gilvigrisea]OIV38314.1 hypothetical protein BIV57_06535 [Mangrovactinospora gilvigrisea]
MSDRFVEVSLDKRGVACTARLLDDKAPATCAAVWDALPLGGDVYHAKYARNEIYALVPSFAPEGAVPGLENPTVTPIPGDLVYFAFADWQLGTASHGYGAAASHAGHRAVVDLAFFYERNNLLLNADTGWVPGSVFGTVVDGLDRFADACQDLWRRGAEGETLSYRRA